MVGALLATPAHAATYYWDVNGSTAGFGQTNVGTNAGLLNGTWGTSTFWSTSSAGTATTANSTTTTSDSIFFGTSAINLQSGSGGGAITINAGSVNAGNVSIFTDNRDFTLNTGTITLANGGTIGWDNNGGGSWFRINSVIAGSGTVTWGFAGAGNNMRLNTAATYTGPTVVAAGQLVAVNANVLPNNGDISVTGGTLNLAANQAIGGLTWSGGSITGSGTVTINNGGGTGVKISGASRDFTQDIVLASNDLDFQAESSRVMTLSGNISGAQTMALYYSSAGAGRTILSGSNSFSGGLNIQQGVLTVGGSFAIPTTGTMTVANGTQLQLNGYNVTVQGLNLAGTGVSDGAINNNSATAVTFTPTNGTTLTGNANVGGSGDITFNNGISGGSSLTKVGAGGVTLTGAGSYTGATNVNAGTLTFRRGATSASSGITVASGAALEFDNNAGNMTFATPAVALSGTLAYTATGNNYVVLNTGSVNVPANANSVVTLSSGGVTNSGLFFDSGLTGSGTLTVRPANNGVGLVLRTSTSTFTGDIIVGGSASTTAGTGSGLVLGNNSGAPNLSGADFTVNGTLELGNSTSGMGWAAGNTSGVTSTIGALNGSGVVVANMQTASSTRTISVGNTNVSGTFSGVIANGANNTLAFTKVGTGTQTLSGANTYTGATTVNAGILALGASDRLSNSTAVTVAGGGLGMSTFNDTVASLTITSGSVFGSGTLTASTYGLGGGTVAANLGGGTLNVTANSTLSGAAAATTVNLNSGTLTLSSAGRLATTAAVSGSSGAALALGGNETIGSLSGTAGVTLGANTLTVGDGSSTTYAGVLAGSGGGLTKQGAGSLTLNAANTYTGATTVNAGSLVLAGGANRLPSGGSVSVAAGATLDLNGQAQTLGALTGSGSVAFGGATLTLGSGNASTNFAGSLLGTGTLTKTGTGVFTFNGSVGNGIATSVSTGRFVVNGLFGNGSLSVASAAWLLGSGTVGGDVTVNGTLSPGNSPGLLTFGSLVLGGTSTTIMEMVGTTRGTGYDAVDVTAGDLTYGGSLELNFAQLFGDNTSFQLFGVTGGGSRLGTFASVTTVGSYGTLSLTNNGSGVWTSGTVNVSQQLRFTESTGALVIVPEPGTLTLLAGAAGLALLLSRRRIAA